MVQVAQGTHFLVDHLQFVVGGFDFAKVDHAHVHERRTAFGIDTDDPEA